MPAMVLVRLAFHVHLPRAPSCTFHTPSCTFHTPSCTMCTFHVHLPCVPSVETSWIGKTSGEFLAQSLTRTSHTPSTNVPLSRTSTWTNGPHWYDNRDYASIASVQGITAELAQAGSHVEHVKRDTTLSYTERTRSKMQHLNRAETRQY